jgi:hypothetical protein
VISLPNIIHFNKVCENCVVGKQHCKEFPQRKSWRAKKVLELVHSDLCGPINPSSNGGQRYFITFVAGVRAPTRRRLATVEACCRASCVRCCVLGRVFGFNHKIMINV